MARSVCDKEIIAPAYHILPDTKLTVSVSIAPERWQ
jgi:hypothetical protein